LVNCISAEYQPYACLTSHVTSPRLELSLDVPEEFIICTSDIAEVTFNLTNTGTGPAANVHVEPALSDGMQLVNAAEVRKSFALRAGETKTVKAQIRMLEPGEYVLTARAVGDGGLLAEDSGKRLVVRQGHIVLAAHGPEEEYVGLPIDYQVEVRNEGDARSREVILTASYPGDVEFIEDGSTNCERSTAKAVWRLGTLPAGEQRTVNLRLREVNGARTVRTVLSATGICSGTDTKVILTKLTGVPAMLVEAVDKLDPNKVGEQEHYEIRVSNQGSADQTNVTVTAILPDEMTFLNAEGPTPAHVEGRTVSFQPLGTLGPKQSQTWKVFGRCEVPGDARFKVRVESDQHELPVTETEATRIYE
jgi:uncharacterized repeat protein (TIGR01451 family)